MVCNSWVWSRCVGEGGIKTLWDKVRIILGKSWPKEQFSRDVYQNKWKERPQGKDYKYSQSSSQHYPLACSQDTGVGMRVEVQFSSVQSLSHVRLFATPWTTASTPGLPAHHQLPEFTQTHLHWVSDSIQPSHPLSSPSPAFNPSPYQGLFKWVSSSHQMAKVLEFQLQQVEVGPTIRREI